MGVAPEVHRVDRHQPQHLRRTVGDLVLRHRRVGAARVPHLFGQGHDRVEGVHGVLHNHRELSPPNVAQLLVAHRHHLAAAKNHAPARYPGVPSEQLGNGKKKGRLPAAGLPHYGQELSVVEVQVDPVDGDNGAALGGISDR